MDLIFFALWFFLPAGVANMAPIIAARLTYMDKWETPMDCGLKLRGKRIFGENKTWRGLLSGIVAAIAVVYVQQLIWQNGAVTFDAALPIDYLEYSPVLLGLLFGAGALLGDAIESFIKRQKGIPAGDKWFPFDQIDYIIGGCMAMALLAPLSIPLYLLILALWFTLHLIFSYLGYLLHLKPRPI